VARVARVAGEPGRYDARDVVPGIDALLLVSFGGPDGPDDVMPFLRNVTRGRDVPEARLAEVAEHYHHFGGRSPINDQNRTLLAALREELAPLPVYWGNRNWKPFLADALAAMTADGVRRAACFITSAFASYSGCRQYREDLADALAAGGPDAPELVKLRGFFDHPGFVEPMADGVRDALATLEPREAAGAHLVFVAHSIPLTQARKAGTAGGAYEQQLHASARAIVDRVNLLDEAERGERRPARPFSIAYSSRSGPRTVPWLTPDVGDELATLADTGVEAVVLVPVGFVSDHMEVVFDLDIEAAGRGRAAGLAVVRAATVGSDRRFVAMVGEMLAERVDPSRPRRALSALGPAHDVCPLWCCEPQVSRPAAAGTSEDLVRTRPGTGGRRRRIGEAPADKGRSE
jgi:ferrochelatase